MTASMINMMVVLTLFLLLLYPFVHFLEGEHRPCILYAIKISQKGKNYTYAKNNNTNNTQKNTRK